MHIFADWNIWSAIYCKREHHLVRTGMGVIETLSPVWSEHPAAAQLFILILYLGVCIKNHFPQVYRWESLPPRLVCCQNCWTQNMFSCLFKVCLLQNLKCQGTVTCQQMLMIDKLFSFLVGCISSFGPRLAGGSDWDDCDCKSLE